MKKGLLIYKKQDYELNKTYASMLIEYGKSHHMQVQLVLYEDIQYGVDQEGLWIQHQGQKIGEIDFVINRSRESMLSRHLEWMNIKVFNSYEVTHLANHKGRTHQFISHIGIPALKTLFWNATYMTTEYIPFEYPFVIKAPEGHGGTEVFVVHHLKEVEQILEKYPYKEWIFQQLCLHTGEDVRVFIIGGKIIGAIRRFSKTDFRANYCLGGEIEWYELSQKEKELVEKILAHLVCDYVGIDFIIDEKGDFIFNEIEDAVGSRSLYTLKKVDTARLYMEHIAKCMDQ